MYNSFSLVYFWYLSPLNISFRWLCYILTLINNHISLFFCSYPTLTDRRESSNFTVNKQYNALYIIYEAIVNCIDASDGYKHLHLLKKFLHIVRMYQELCWRVIFMNLAVVFSFRLICLSPTFLLSEPGCFQVFSQLRLITARLFFRKTRTHWSPSDRKHQLNAARTGCCRTQITRCDS